jgi:drug/metabolite transporter (DMT)-like permease
LDSAKAAEKNVPRQPQSSALKSLRSYAALIVLSTIWGMAFPAIRIAITELSPVNLAILRWLIASTGFLVLVPLIGKPKTKFQRNDLPRLLVIAFANVVAYHLSINFGESTVSAGLAGILVSTGPVFIVALSAITLKERIGSRIALSLVSALIGVIVLSIGGLNAGSASAIGIIELLITAVSYAVFAVLSKPLVQKYGAPPIAIWAALIGTVMLLPFISQSLVTQVASLSSAGWASVLYLSILSTVIGYLLFYTLVSRGAVSRLSIQLYIIPVISVIGGVFLLGESVTVYTIIGGAAVLLGVALTTKRN